MSLRDGFSPHTPASRAEAFKLDAIFQGHYQNVDVGHLAADTIGNRTENDHLANTKLYKYVKPSLDKQRLILL